MAEDIPRQPKPDDLPEIEWSGGWSERPTIPGPEREEVCMDTFVPAAGSTTATQVIYLQEGVKGDVPIAKLNYNGPGTPEIRIPILVGSFNLLGPRIVRSENDEWLLVITQEQDFESPGMQQYMFEISVTGESVSVLVNLLIANIDDNDPIIHSIAACQVPELGEAPRLTDCAYRVSDLDGELSIRVMTFEINSDRNDEEIFSITSSRIPFDQFNMTMTIGLQTTLNFETSPLHIFQITALDSVENSHTVTQMVQVENVEHRPPRWVTVFAVQQFDEKTVQSFTLRAIDGDTGINKLIDYELERDENENFFSIEPIGRDGVILHVDPIDRDYLEREVFHLSIIAYKYDNRSFATAAPITIIVNDINDQRPVPLQKEYFVEILEETPLTINFDEEFGFHDRDLGPHAQYEVRLESVYPENAHTAFYIAPNVGYQRQTFTMGTTNHSMLDYEDIPFQNIRLKVIATDMNNTDFEGVAYVNIDLINWNDEEPIFDINSLTVRFKETEGKGYCVGTMLATDRDIGDEVEHSLMGNAGDYLSIDSESGEIIVSIDNAFDYHRQHVLFVQVRADDTLMAPFHTATSQLIIELEDVNNTPPTMRLPRGSPNVEENVPEGYEITRNITATDPDTTAHLRFEINWNTSYATKQGRDTPAVEYHGCVDIETIFPDPTTNGTAIGRIVVKEIRDNITIDYEEFEMLYITVQVWDDNTVLGTEYDESTLTITIIDMNDNPPIFSAGTLAQEFRVRELSDSDTIIGSVFATDIDGPLYNQVRYTIVPRNDTPEDLVKIDFYTGQISVDKNGAIDADIPPRWELHYTIVASDKCYAEDIEDCPPDPVYWNTEGNITIQILDTNNRIPTPDTTMYNETVYIFENATSGDFVQQLFSNDLDRDEIYHTVSYLIDFAVNDASIYFAVELDTGVVTVEYSTNAVLDRDGDYPTHRIFFNVFDNYYFEGGGRRNQNTAQILVILLDVNDNAPRLPADESWSISENEEVGHRLVPDIYAPDDDEEDTDNSRVGYAILDLTITDRDISVPQLFHMIQIKNVTGELEVAMPLKGYWGTYSIHVLAYDHGIPQQMSNETYEIEIRPYNFHDPEFVFPVSGTFVRLARERAAVNVMLAKVDGDFLDRLSATDEDGLHAGVVNFEVVGNAEALNYFAVVNEGENQGFLTLTQVFTEEVREFQIVIRATDGGTEPGTRFTETTLNVIYVPTSGDPVFEQNTYNVAFLEKEGGLEEIFKLPDAKDPKNERCTDDCFPIYYRIFDGNDDGYFGLDTNEIFLLKELDREQAESYVINVAASNSLTAGNPLPASTLTVNIAVREANPRPNFVQDLYLAGLSINHPIGRELLTVRATHSDGATITYTIDEDSMVVDPSLEAVRESPFLLNPTTGVLTLNMQPNAAMEGMFEFDVVATDPAGETDKTEVRIYIVSSGNRVVFIFLNTVAQVEQHRNFIADTLSTGFDMECIIDDVLRGSNNAGVAQDDVTEVRAHFIDDNRPVPVEVIEAIRTDTAVLHQIQRTLSTELLILQDMATDISPVVDKSRIIVYVLAGLAGFLALLCVILILVYIIKTRNLNTRLKAMSVTRFGSIDSGQERAGAMGNYPGANKHTVEGSNPVWNTTVLTPDFDAKSDVSGDSDLIGIEDLPQFRADYFPDDNEYDNNEQVVASHNNNFKFNKGPFTYESALETGEGPSRRM
ncbi:protocadherin Fat 4-like [Hyposmocoma kahamanoa]|uniref:protocadherin Fat 4-like n=1 Tax=Hyposmocoma kahamanoa TaxID=1477025 RepID=UPI000E6D6074|nr:protocadherin Fat 4-like [Hyposmocoma kahamanoa]